MTCETAFTSYLYFVELYLSKKQSYLFVFLLDTLSWILFVELCGYPESKINLESTIF